ncbi:MAG TPA: hypothetical protein VJW55_07990 [Candidatus Angelobacter sp.]|nr:hypothetical protein [Candidatus Angelobacter sp.]
MARKPMDPFARKMVQGTLVYGSVMLVMFAVLTGVYLHTRPRCSDRVVAEATNPGNQWTATVMERRCGEDAPFLTHVNLRPAGTEIQRGFFSGSTAEGEVFLVEQDAASTGITLQWSPGALTIHCPHCSPDLEREKDQHWGSVTINYATP